MNVKEKLEVFPPTIGNYKLKIITLKGWYMIYYSAHKKIMNKQLKRGYTSFSVCQKTIDECINQMFELLKEGDYVKLHTDK